jgi:predicted ATP-grasp superfamily ATP-dependent carboligase
VPEPHELYQLNDDLPELGRPVLIQALTGFVDAGAAGRLAREHLLTTLTGRVIATFDIDALLDYRSRRPIMMFVEDHWESYEEPELALHVLYDESNTPFLLLAGPEPDLYWDRFTAAVTQIIDRLGVRLTVGFNAIPMAVPHTRPTGVTAHATRRELITGYEPWLRRVQVPGAAGHLLEYRLGQQGKDAMGFAVHVPHYLAQAEFADGAVTALNAITAATGLNLPIDDLVAQAGLNRAEIAAEVERSDEVSQVIAALERQYDTFIEGRQKPSLLATDVSDLPSADEIGAEFEQFLREVNDDQADGGA